MKTGNESADDLTVGNMNRRGRNLHRNPPVIPAAGEGDDRHLDHTPGHHGALQGTMFLAAHAVAVFIFVAPEIIQAAATGDCFGPPSGNLFRHLIPVDNSAIEITYRDLIIQ